MLENERLFEEPKVFDREYTLKFALMCMVAIGIIVLSWTYSFKSNVVLALNDSNEQIFNDKFMELSTNSDWGEYRNISGYAQKIVTLKEINRSGYNVNRVAFASLPLIPSDWGKIKFAFDGGKTFMLGRIGGAYYMQPEFYDDWYTMGLPFFEEHDQECKAGMFADPYVQKIYSRIGASVGTTSIVRTSFCVNQPQAVSFVAMYPSYVESLANENYMQDPMVVSKYITLKADPGYIILGEAYPKFSKDWAQKINVTITVSPDTPKGVYVIALGVDKYDPWFGKRTDVNYDAYKSKNGAPLAHYVMAID